MAILNEPRMIDNVNLAWDLSEMDGSGYAERATLLPGVCLECQPLPPNSRYYGAYVGGQRVSTTEHDMPDGAMAEAEEFFQAAHPVLTAAQLDELIAKPLRAFGFTVCGYIATGKTLSFSAWGKPMVGVLYQELKDLLKAHPVSVKVSTVYFSPAGSGWYNVQCKWVY